MACKVSGTAFITGGGNGIGKTTAFTLAQNGIEALSLLDVNEVLLQRTKNELATSHPNVAVELTVGDVSKEACVDEAVRRTVERFGRIDISVHCAGIVGQPTATHELTAAEWQRVIDINQTGVLLCQKAVIRQMLTQEYVSLVHLRGRRPAKRLADRADAKAYIQQEIRINAICPGYTDTDLIRTYWDAGFMEPDSQRVAIGRRAQPEEIADALLFLASPMSSYMHWINTIADGLLNGGIKSN
ncbi:short chain dehydrogenase/reductase family oxidoreductase [Aspergillus luchuensis]|uniref:Short chain dehydrogenase/reductase family oxidoreductase n=1 Tax=Aspergillus kawachii TaxID=1069201 RepID=A0A146EYU5_ASPKA|nr:short chain dehydrogenase/reductase family oxidoreductase [Aspergillus luchuensis]